MYDYPHMKARVPVPHCPRGREERRKKAGLHVSLPHFHNTLHSSMYGIVWCGGSGKTDLLSLIWLHHYGICEGHVELFHLSKIRIDFAKSCT